MTERWNALMRKAAADALDAGEKRLLKRLQKTILLLSDNPKDPGLQSHEIDSLTKRYKQKVWQSYLENNTPAAGRIFWLYGPEKGVITIIGLEDHPERGGYGRVVLSKTRQIKPAQRDPRD
jgi:hypothetical protein